MKTLFAEVPARPLGIFSLAVALLEVVVVVSALHELFYLLNKQLLLFSQGKIKHSYCISFYYGSPITRLSVLWTGMELKRDVLRD